MKMLEKKPKKDWHSARTEQQPEIFPSSQSPAFRFFYIPRGEKEKGMKGE